MTTVTVSTQTKQTVTTSHQAKPSVSVYRKGDTGDSAYQSYLNTTEDNPVLTEAEWIASMGGLSKATIEDINTGTESAKYIVPSALAGSAYRRIFIQTEEPTAPQNGDLWIVKRV
jgi:hypothetical protein